MSEPLFTNTPQIVNKVTEVPPEYMRPGQWWVVDAPGTFMVFGGYREWFEPVEDEL